MNPDLAGAVVVEAKASVAVTAGRQTTPRLINVILSTYRIGVCAALGALGFTALASPASGDLIQLATAKNTKCSLESSWNWTFAAPEGATVPNPAGPWTASVNTTRIPDDAGDPNAPKGRVGVLATVQHTPGTPACDANERANAVPMVMAGAGPLFRAPAGGPVRHLGSAAQVTHDKHRDVARFSAEVDPAGAPARQGKPAGTIGSILVEALHAPAPVGVNPSLRNYLPVPVRGSIAPDYRLPDGRPHEDNSQRRAVELAANMKESLVLKKPFAKSLPFGPPDAALASINWTFRGSPISSTTVAFIGLVDGIVTELDLDAGILLFSGSEFEVPVLRSEATDLFIGVDLTQWLTSPTLFDPLATLVVASGTSDLLPGFIIGTSEITFGPRGFETAAPFTGEVFVSGVIDGHIPEPAPIALLTTGLIYLNCHGRCRRSRRRALDPRSCTRHRDRRTLR